MPGVVYICRKCGSRYVVLNGTGAPQSYCFDGKMCETYEVGHDGVFPSHCSCGCPVRNVYDADGSHPWASYTCGTDRAGKGSPPLDNGSMTERSDLCRYIGHLKRKAGLTKTQAIRLWEV